MALNTTGPSWALVVKEKHFPDNGQGLNELRSQPDHMLSKHIHCLATAGEAFLFCPFSTKSVLGLV